MVVSALPRSEAGDPTFRIFVAGLFHETHTFLDSATTLADFECRSGESLTACAGDSSPLGGAIDLFQQLGHHVLPGTDYRATPGGKVADGVVGQFLEELESTWNPEADAIFLALHGAMVSDSSTDAEGEILSRIRRNLPHADGLPIFGVYDLHANFSRKMANEADLLLAYRENPHRDARESAVRAAELLLRHLNGEFPRPTTHLRQTGLILAPVHTATNDEPMRSLESAAREIERDNPRILSVNINAGFAYADTPDTGLSVQIAALPGFSVETHLDDLEKTARKAPSVPLTTDEPVDLVMGRLLSDPVDGLTVIVEPSDNIGAGAPGDGTGVLRAILARRIQHTLNSAICLRDPVSLQRLEEHAPGDSVNLEVGGRGSRFDEGPVPLQVELISRSDGFFELEDKQSHLASMTGDTFCMGPCAVVRHGSLSILLTTNRTPPFDLAQWRSQGIEPSELDLIVVKAAVAHRRTYDPIAAREFCVDTPGPCRSDLIDKAKASEGQFR